MSKVVPPKAKGAPPPHNFMLPVVKPAVRNPLTSFIKQWFLVLFAMTGLAAYSAGPIPIAWLAQCGFISLAAGLILFNDRIRLLPGTIIFAVFLGWAVFVTTVHLNEFSGLMPPLVTMPYWAYVTFRYLNFIAFASAMYLTNWLVTEGEGEAVVRGVILIATGICIVSLYIYAAHIFHLPEPPRNRAGTAGAGQATSFSSEGFFYARATGTFREPSGLAEWLILPFFLSFIFREKRDKIRSAIISGTMILTVSMIGFFSVTSGSLIAFFLTRPFSKRTYKILGAAILVGGILYGLLSQITIGVLGNKSVSLATILGNRVVLTLVGGVGNSNRSYVYEFMKNNPFPPLGMGFGNGNLMFSNVTSNETIVAFLSLYIFTLYSVGYPGMFLLGAFLALPVVKYVTNFRKTLKAIPLILMAYIGYLVASAVGAEELSPWFGIAAGLLTCEARRLAWANKYFRPARKAAAPAPALNEPRAVPG
jgi:hypothetical protein